MYIGSFSKILGPGIRLGFFIAPQAIATRLMPWKIDGGTSALAQMIAAEYFKANLWEHVDEGRLAVKDKRNQLLDALETEFTGVERLRAICDRHGILLIFDEVITGFGRLGYAFAAERYGVAPDLITFAKGVTSGAVPMGGVIARDGIYEAFMRGPEHAIELFHGYTYSAHPLACAAGLATLELYRDEKLFARAKALEPHFAEAVMTLKGLPGVLDIRTVGASPPVSISPHAPARQDCEPIRRWSVRSKTKVS